MQDMPTYIFNADKNGKLKTERNISFEQIICELEANRILDIVQHPNAGKYPNQQVFIVAIDGYVYAVPFIESGKYYFLKTIFPSRKLKKKYLFK